MIEDFTIIEMFEYPNYKFSVKLGERYFVLEFIENDSNNSVCLNIYNNSENPVLLGMKAVTGLNLINGVVVEGLPTGTLIIMTRDLSRDLIVSDDLDGVFLLYSEIVYDDIFEAMI